MRPEMEALYALAGLGWMPCADSPFWCFCAEPSEPGLHHTPECRVASSLLAKVGFVGSDGDPPTAEQLVASTGTRMWEEEL